MNEQRPWQLFAAVAQSRSVDRTTSLRSDQTIRFNGPYASKHWPDPMRRVSIYDSVHHRRLAFWTNLWELPAATIAELYRQRWQIELFFRWIKDNLRLRSFYGTSPDAVRLQIWSAISAYLAAAITRRSCKITTNLTTFTSPVAARPRTRSSRSVIYKIDYKRATYAAIGTITVQRLEWDSIGLKPGY